MIKKIRILTIPILLIFSSPLLPNDVERKKYHFLISPWIINTTFEKPSRELDSSVNLQFLYGLTNNLYLGVTYGIGKNGDKSLESFPSSSYFTSRIYQFSTSKNSETFTLNLQYFIWKFVYTSFNIGIEKGFSVERNNLAIIRANNITPQPFSMKTIFDDRTFSSIGIGFRHELSSSILIAFEYQRGYIEAGKVNQHFTYNPDYYVNNLPYMLENFYLNNILNDTSLKNSLYQQFYLSAGFAL
ncbi:Hypothetical protein LBF_2119 [Leptospira biflexa serovar Patoc strain 'Patoc 1 (Ames)']|uniref:Outer membrane protein beta-barrel domain-containing protein n=1 Tax=Leptospira biflexa serovar Patoc (strain Patoc 1 / ATCC 23582 / Paris) TaxID=456481 RepID=B0ST39_LEPBP|nr:hypothetical protein [Leptospira biflexa]ABZ94616.1 Hypothetical protein LBF_2119 [Leptospira biflexa serovar Patoc strain 'Patoc 1 (Ames)']ABZ98279.1 Hypothetical protein LEPBI_I2180 [Leptospira biflexa serovar Patoc strain 'Patoc 1 (Paris)']